MTTELEFARGLLEVLRFAAGKHRDQRRKDSVASPYINHTIEVAGLIACEGGFSDLATLQAAVLHDTVEDTETTFEELEDRFGTEVAGLVKEVTDEKGLAKERRKQLQIEHAPHLSCEAKHIKIADKISNITAVTFTPPKDWSEERRREYLDWSELVVKGCRGVNQDLEALYDQRLGECRRIFEGTSEATPD